MKYCSNCGGQVDEDDIYCGNCGSKLKQDAQNNFSKQDFEEVSSARDDSRVDFGSDFRADAEFSNAQDERANEPYVEQDNSYESYTAPNNSSQNNNSGNERKPLLHNKLAKDANTFGVLALIFGLLIGGIFGIVFGIIGIVKANRALELCNSGEYDGKAKASNGRVLSILGIVFGALWIVLYLL